jgi:hypothetical protein
MNLHKGKTQVAALAADVLLLFLYEIPHVCVV